MTIFSGGNHSHTFVPLNPFYKKIIEDDGIRFIGSAAVSDTALEIARHTVNRMLATLPAVRESMRQAQFRVEIIARNEVISDLPDYKHLKNQFTFDGRDFDTGTRGVGTFNHCSAGEENLLCDTKQPYHSEDVLVHEFAHSILFHLDLSHQNTCKDAFQIATKQKLYNASIYMMKNLDEYWAVATQAWFSKTLRTDVNDGYNTADTLLKHDPRLARLLMQVFGQTSMKRLPGCAY